MTPGIPSLQGSHEGEQGPLGVGGLPSLNRPTVAAGGDHAASVRSGRVLDTHAAASRSASLGDDVVSSVPRLSECAVPAPDSYEHAVVSSASRSLDCAAPAPGSSESTIV
jgi:hypothetical protein